MPRRSSPSGTPSPTSKRTSNRGRVTRVDRPGRVVITGVGAVTPIGNTADEFWTALVQGASGIGPITRFDATGFPTRIAGELKGFEPLNYSAKDDARTRDPFLNCATAW